MFTIDQAIQCKHFLPLFPENRELVDIWKENCAITRPVKKTDAVCEKHFQSECFKKTEIRFPTINLKATTLDHTAGTGFPLKDARLSILKNIPHLHSDDRKG